MNTKLVPLLYRLAKAILKPQQLVFAMKVFLLPKVYYLTVLGRKPISSLNSIDKRVRGFVRQWTTLPIDTPIAYFHAPVAEEGLETPSFRLMTALQRRKRLMAMLLHHNVGKVENLYLAREIAFCTRRLVKTAILSTIR